MIIQNHLMKLSCQKKPQFFQDTNPFPKKINLRQNGKSLPKKKESKRKKVS